MNKQSKINIPAFITLGLIMFILSIGFISSANPHDIPTTVGLNIQGSSVPHLIPINKNLTFNFHVYNASNGMPVRSGITCYMHIYNATGNHIANLKTSTVLDDFDYEFIVTSNNFTTIGNFSNIIQCNSSNQGGATGTEFNTYNSSIIKVASPSQLFNIDLTLFQNNIILIILFILAIVLFGFKQYLFSGVMLLFGGILMAFNGINLIISMIIMVLGITILYQEQND